MFHTTINIKPILSNTLDSRDEASRLFELLKGYCIHCENLVLDFSEIDFMSRSFADQFHKEKMKWHEDSHVPILIQNADVQIIEILKAVSKTQKAREHNSSQPTTFYSFSKKDQLFNYLNML